MIESGARRRIGVSLATRVVAMLKPPTRVYMKVEAEDVREYAKGRVLQLELGANRALDDAVSRADRRPGARRQREEARHELER